MSKNFKRYCGFSDITHDAGIAFLSLNGDIEFATHSERYSRKKHDTTLHEDLIDMISDDDHVTFFEDVSLRLEGYRGGTLHHSSKRFNMIYDSLDYDECLSHHKSHAATGLYTRPWEDITNTVILSIDGVGETQTTVIFNHNLEVIEDWHSPRSLGFAYALLTREFGLHALSDDYVVMGMSVYGEPIFGEYLVEQFYNLPYEVKYTGKVGVGFQRLYKELLDKNSVYDVAASAQYLAEYVFNERVSVARKYGSKLILTGGCAQNIIAATKIRPMFDDMHIPVAPNDAGSALGAAAYTYCKRTGNTRINWEHAYLGYDMKNNINPKEVVDYIIQNEYCGVASGKAEFGPRALGNRSLLADVRHDVKDTVNKIKRRQKFRPFAPAILEEFAEEYFDGYMNEYMQYTSKAKHDYKSVIHADGTSRVQIVKKDCTSIIRTILEEYYDRTSVPMLLNTSLNIRGKPMVNNQNDAIDFEKKYNVKVFY